MKEGELNLTKNILRILTRIIPILHQHEKAQMIKQWLWNYLDPNISVEEVQMNKD